MTLTTFIDSVDRAVTKLTKNQISLTDLPDFADGENSLSEMYEEGLLPRAAARRLLFALGMEDALNCWSTECDYCEHEWDCPHIG